MTVNKYYLFSFSEKTFLDMLFVIIILRAYTIYLYIYARSMTSVCAIAMFHRKGGMLVQGSDRSLAP